MTVERRIVGGIIACGRASIALSLLFAAPEAATAASEAPEIGEADLVVSLVRGRRGETTRELAIKDNVYSEEVIETDADAAARLIFVDGTELSMGPSSRMVLDRYVYDPGAGTGEMAMRMVTGVFEFASGNIPSSGYDIDTPFGNLAVRGTRCVVDVVAGSRLVLRCSEVDPAGVSIGGATVNDASDCLLVPLPGTGNPVFLASDECDEQLARVQQMFATLGLVEPAAGPITPAQFDNPQGPGAENDPDPPGFGGAGASPQ
jgi:FecR protein